MKNYWESGGIAPRILDLGTRWCWVVSFSVHPGTAPEPAWTRWWREKYPALAGNRNL